MKEEIHIIKNPNKHATPMGINKFIIFLKSIDLHP